MKKQLTKKFMSNLSLEKECPICHTGKVSAFLEILQVPIHIGLQWSSKESAKQCPKGNINLGFCRFCGFITNLSFEPSILNYTEPYDNSLDISSCFQDYARSLALHLVKRYKLFNKDLISIGCGKGYFLRLLCEFGGNRGVGFDPSYREPRNKTIFSKRTTFIKDYYSEQYQNVKVDFICCRHVLEHIQNPTEFLSMLRNMIQGRYIPVYFEVPNMLFTLHDLSIWDIIYEHCSFFSPRSLSSAFTSCGFSVCDLYETFGRQFLAIEALPYERKTGKQLNNDESSSELTQRIMGFTNKYYEKLEFWQDRIECFNKTGERVVVWGAGSKGVSFLNTLKIQDQIEYVVDINPNKQGMYIAGTGQQVISPDFLRKYRPDILIIMNQLYQKEIKQILDSLGLDPAIFYA